MPRLEPAGRGITAPARGVVAVTPSNSVDLETVTRGLYVGVSGNVAVEMDDGTTATFVGLAAGVIHPLMVKRVNSTSTTATSILAVY